MLQFLVYDFWILEGLELLVKQNGRYYTRKQVADGHAPPDTGSSHESREDDEARKEEQQLSGEWQEDGLVCHADTLDTEFVYKEKTTD